MRRLNYQLFCCHPTSLFAKCSVKNFSNGLFNRNFYEVLGVERNASQSDIKKAFYTLSKKYHPDIIGSSNAKSTEKFLEVKEAYDVLKDEGQRRFYDHQLDSAYGGFNSASTSSTKDYSNQHKFYQHVRRSGPTPNNQYSYDDFSKVWKSMQQNKEFQNSNKDFYEFLRRAQERSQNEYARKRQEQWRKFNEEQFEKRPFHSPLRKTSIFNNFNNKSDWKIVNKVMAIYFSIFILSALYQHFRHKSRSYGDDNIIYTSEKSQSDRIYDMIHRPPTRF